MNPGKLLVWLLAAGCALQTSGAITLGRWQLRHPHPSDYNSGLAHDGKKFVLVDRYGHIFTSISGRNWTLQNTPMLPLRSVAFGKTNFVAVGLNGTILSSAEGTNWISSISPTTNELTAITFTGQRFVAVGFGGTIVSSENGMEFVIEQSTVTNDLLNVDIGPGTVLAVGDRTVLVSTNSGEWKQALVTTTNYFSDVTYFKGAYHNGYYATTNPMIWTNRVSGFGNVAAVAATTNAIGRVFVGLTRNFQWSSDGTSWGNSFAPVGFPYAVTTISNRFQLLANSDILFGDQFHRFTQMAVNFLTDAGSSAIYFGAIAANNDGFAARDSAGRVFASEDAQGWRLIPKGGPEPTPNLDDLTTGQLPWARSSITGTIEVTDDGTVWQNISGPEASVRLAGAIGNTIVAAGTSNLWATSDRVKWTKIKTKEGPLIYVADDSGTHPEPDRWVLSFSRGNGMIVATTSWGELLFSSDGFDWQIEPTMFPRIVDAAITAEKVVVATWKGIAEARLDGGVNAVGETKLRITSDRLDVEGPVRFHEIQQATDFLTWNFFSLSGTNRTLQIDSVSQPIQFFRAVQPE
ncbi:MAG TPA: hypothetical protein VI282_07880 [Verrucomicrobiae bacterium]